VPVRQERTGWRDLRINDRHRKFGQDCPGVDLDFLFLEYDKGKPVAIVEYKHEFAAPQYAKHPSYQALIRLGNQAQLPVFCCRYKDDFSAWAATPLNARARAAMPERCTMTERGWVTFLYHLRGRQPEESLFDGDSIRV
jgi:hypothetical protein